MTLNEMIVANVRYLAKLNCIKIGEIENKVGVSTGYFSRTVKRDSSMTAETLYKVSEILKVSMDDLCSDIKLWELEEMAKAYGYKLVKEVNENDED